MVADQNLAAPTVRAVFAVKALALGVILTFYLLLNIFVSRFAHPDLLVLAVLAALMPTVAVVTRTGTVPAWLLRLSLGMDAVMLSVGVHLGGGVDNVSVPLLYTALVSLAAMLMTRADTFAAALICILGYDLVVYAEYLDLLPHQVSYGRPPDRQLATVVPVNLFLLLYAWLASYVVERTRAMYQRTEQLRRDAIQALSHDLKNPLSVIHGYARLMQNAEPAEREAFAHGVERTAQQALDLVSNVLDAASFEGRPIKPRVHPVALDDLIREVADRYRHLAEAARVQLLVESAVDLPIAEVDGQLVSRALGNLISNAIKYTPAAGSVQVTTEALNGNIVISVRDTGAGLAPEELSTLFQRYSRASSARGVEGSGLGLYIVRCIAEAHRGSVMVSSAVGHGTTFTLSLPIVARTG